MNIDRAVFASLTVLSLLLVSSDFLLSDVKGNLFWWFQGIENVESVVPIEDQDGDGWPEAVVMSYDAGAPSGDDLFLIKGNSSEYGEVIWSTKPYGGLSGGGGYGDQCLSTTTDISGDGLADILLGTAWGGRTAFAIAGNSGDVLFEYDTYIHPPSAWCYAVNPIEDLNGDGLDEVLAAFGNDTRAAFCFDGASVGEATVIWEWNADYDGVESICSIGDVNNSGYADALIGCGGNFIDNRVVVVEGGSLGDQASTIWTYETGSTVQDVSVIRDVNGSGIDDALAGGWDDFVYCIEGGSSGTGEVIWQQFIGTVIMKVESINDVDADGIDDVLVGSWDNAIICLDGAGGDQIWSTPTGSLNGGDVWTIYPIADVDGDGKEDVLAGSFDTKIYCVSGVSGDIIWTYTTGNRLYTVRSIPDVNGDGVPEAIGGTQMIGGIGGKVYCIEGDSQGPWIQVMVEPDTNVVLAGETIGMTITVENRTVNFQEFDAWINARTPWGSTVPLLIESEVTLPAGVSVSPHVEISVPSVAPSGIYQVFTGVGDYGFSVMDLDSFSLRVINLESIEEKISGYNRGYRVDEEVKRQWKASLVSTPFDSEWKKEDRVMRVRAPVTCHMERDTWKTVQYRDWAIKVLGPNTSRILAARRIGIGPADVN
jgi:outer membrane protein assembly factor BamB